MGAWLLNVLVFLAAFLAVCAANAVLLDLSAGDRRRLNEQVNEQLRQRERKRITVQNVGRTAPITGNSRATVGQIVNGMIEQSGLGITAGRLLAISLGLSVAAGLLCGFATASLLLALVAAAVGGALPVLYVLHARRLRFERLLSQLPDAFDLMGRVLRSGQTVSQAMKLVADEFSPPLSLEFFRCHEQMNLGMSVEAAVHDLAQRIGLLEIKIFAVAVLVQRQAGGNLSELFDKMGTLVRERFRIRGLIRSLTAQGRMQAWLLLSLPVAMFALLMAINPEYEMVLLDYPLLILTALALMGLGALWINKVVHFDY